MTNGEEKLSLLDVDTGKTLELKVIDRKEVRNTNERTERVLFGVTPGNFGREKRISMIIKRVNNLTVNDEQKTMPLADVWISKWRMLRQAGIPVVTTIRKVSDTEVAMSDLCADGSVVYGKADMSGNLQIHRPNAILVKIDLDEVQEEAIKIAQKADKADILLAKDDPFVLVVHPDETWQVIALDIGNTERKEDFLRKVHPSHAESWNQLAVDELIGYLKVAREGVEPT